jgi:hypothetical protein
MCYNVSLWWLNLLFQEDFDMKFSNLKTLVFLLVAFLVAMLPAKAQDCVSGQCAKSPSDRIASVVVSAVQMPVQFVEHVVCDVQPVRTVVGNTACAVRSLAQSKAETQAANGRCYHVGGGFGGGRYEGVGFSTSSPDAAVRACCYWGKRPVREIGVAQGRRGWYATVIYE